MRTPGGSAYSRRSPGFTLGRVAHGGAHPTGARELFNC